MTTTTTATRRLPPRKRREDTRRTSHPADGDGRATVPPRARRVASRGGGARARRVRVVSFRPARRGRRGAGGETEPRRRGARGRTPSWTRKMLREMRGTACAPRTRKTPRATPGRWNPFATFGDGNDDEVRTERRTGRRVRAGDPDGGGSRRRRRPAAAPDPERLELRRTGRGRRPARRPATDAARDPAPHARVVRRAAEVAEASAGHLSLEFVLRCLPDATGVDETRDATRYVARAHAEACARETRARATREARSGGDRGTAGDGRDDPMGRTARPAGPASPRCRCRRGALGRNGNGNAARGLGAALRLPVRHGVPRRALVEAAGCARCPQRGARWHDSDAAALTWRRAAAPTAWRRACTGPCPEDSPGTEARTAAAGGRRGRPPPQPRAAPHRGRDPMTVRTGKRRGDILKARLQDLLYERQRHCGEASIASIDAPFVRPDRAQEAESWRSRAPWTLWWFFSTRGTAWTPCAPSCAPPRRHAAA